MEGTTPRQQVGSSWSSGAATGSHLRYPLRLTADRHGRRQRRDLLELRHGEPARRTVLHGVRDAVRCALPELRDDEPPQRQVLFRVRHAARGRGPAGSCRGPGCRHCPSPPGGSGSRSGRHTRSRRHERSHRRTTPGQRPVRRPRRVHRVLGGPRRGGSARAPGSLLRHGPRGHRPLRRDGREVHRRRGDGPVGRPGRPRGRRRTGGPGGARPGRRRAGSGRAAGSEGRHPHRGGRRDHRRDRSGDGRGDLVNTASRLQGAAQPGTVLVGEATQRAAADAIVFEHAEDQVLKGKTSPGFRLAGRPGRRPARRGRADGDARGPVRRSRRGAAPAQGPVPRHHTGRPTPAGQRHRPGRDRQVQTGLGVPQVHRRAGRDGLVARRPQPRLRRRDHVLGARRDDPRPGPPPGDRRRADHPGRDRRDARGTRPGPGRAGLDRAGAPVPPGVRVGRRVAAAVRGVADLLRAAGRERPGRDGPRGLPSRRQRAPGLRRPHDGVDPERPDPDPDPVPAGAAGAKTRLGREQAQLHVDPPGAVVDRGNARAPGRPGAGHPQRGARRDRGPGRRGAAIRGRDRPDAPGPGSAGPRGRGLPPGR